MARKKNNSRGIKKRGCYILAAIIILYAVTGIISLIESSADILNYSIRIFVLWGFISLSIAAMMSPFLKEISNLFGRTFVKIHHIFAYIGLGLVTIHPVLFAIRVRSLSVFVPVFSSWSEFWINAGRLALILLYIGLVAVLIRRKVKVWRILHMIVYLTLIMGFIHGVLIGTDMKNTTIIVIFSILMALVISSLIIKRIQIIKKKKN